MKENKQKKETIMLNVNEEQYHFKGAKINFLKNMKESPIKKSQI